MPRSAVARRCRTTAYVGGVLAACAAAWRRAPASRAAARRPPRPPRTPPTRRRHGKSAPRITRVPATAQPGGLVRIRGANLGRIAEVVFLGASGEADDTSVAPRALQRDSLVARVPRTAVAGPVALARADGTRSRASRRALAIVAGPIAPPAAGIDAEVQAHTVFFGARRPAELSYVLGGSEPATVQVELARVADGAAVRTWAAGAVAPGVAQTVSWDGTVDGEVAPAGRYEFRVHATAASGIQATSSAATGPVAEAPGGFTFLPYRFPIVGRHRYGEGGARFGGGRGHQGQDIFAPCGTPLVAARGGTVQFKQYHGRAGHYLVIDGAETGVDFTYMHLRDAALVDEGDSVKTGQLLGYVGNTGVADGCHLHFEQWSGPGWYAGGSAFDPLPDLHAWDATS